MQLQRMVRNLTSFGARQRSDPPEPVDMGAVLRASAKVLAPRLAERGQSLTFTTPDGPSSRLRPSDPAEAGSHNLILNAAEPATAVNATEPVRASADDLLREPYRAKHLVEGRAMRRMRAPARGAGKDPAAAASTWLPGLDEVARRRRCMVDHLAHLPQDLLIPGAPGAGRWIRRRAARFRAPAAASLCDPALRGPVGRGVAGGTARSKARRGCGAARPAGPRAGGTPVVTEVEHLPWACSRA